MRFPYFLTFLLLSNICPAQEIEVNVVPDMSIGGQASKVYSQVRYIPLESKGPSVFSRIDQLEATDKEFFVLDGSQNQILIFDRSGKYVAKIADKNKIQFIESFTLSPSNEIMFRGTVEDKLFVYNLKGKFLREERIPKMVSLLSFFPSGKLIYNIHRPPIGKEKHSTKGYDLFYSNGITSLTDSILPYDKMTEPYDYNPGSIFLTRAPMAQHKFFTRPYEYSAYELSDNGIVQKYRFNFPAAISLPHDFLTNPVYRFKKADYVYDPANSGKIISIRNVQKLGNRLIFETYFEGVRRDRYFAYDLGTKRFLSFGRVTPDESTYFLPTLDPMLTARIVGFSDTSIFVSMSANVLKMVHDSNRSKHIPYPEDLRKVLKEDNELQNPYILELILSND